MQPRTSRSRLRSLLAGEGCVRMASVFDPISARIADDLGCEAALMGGSVVSHVVLGAPDLILLTLSELAEQIGRCTRVTSVPILVDGDHGYGNALNVMRTVEEMDRAGAGAVMVEDTLLPRSYGPSEVPQLLSIEEATGKVRAAVTARGSSDLVVLGRTSAATMTGINDAVARFRSFESAGVDALFIPGLSVPEDLDQIAAATTLPLIMGGASGTLGDPVYLASRRVRLFAAGHQVFAVAVQALYDAMKAVHEGLPPSQLSGMAPKALLDRVTGAGDYQARTRQFLGGA